MNAFRFLLLFFFVAAMSPAFSQTDDHGDVFDCGQVDMTRKFLDAHPELIPEVEQAEAELEEFTRQFAASSQMKNGTHIIPVVFHVVHVNGSENISDEQIHSAIEVLNEDFSATNAEISGVVSEFADLVADVGIEFRLARLDPWGNCTNGINRVVSQTTHDGGDFALKQAVPSWGRSKYLNIWVVKTIPGNVVGFSQLPPSVNGSFGAQIDGIVMQHDYVGRIGTSNVNRSHTLAHETGHWLNLLHTWGNGEVGDPSNCQSTDFVSDTPPTIGTQTCNLSSTSCGSLDNVQNFMDYSFCFAMFTEGQKTRMLAALNSTVAQRANLHSEANLIQTGVLDEDEICEVRFTTDRTPVICAGSSLQFLDESFHNPTEWTWEFPGGSPSASNQQHPTVTYHTPGVYSVSLTAETDINSKTEEEIGYVIVTPPALEAIPYSESFLEMDELLIEEGWVVVNPDGGEIKWEITDEAGYSDNKSIRVRGRLNVNNATEILITPTYDLSVLVQNPLITFKYAHRERSAQSNDRLRVLVSGDCGETWSLRNEFSGSALATVPGAQFSSFVPTEEDHWRQVAVPFVTSGLHTEQFRLKFEFISNEGNNIYIDDINITGVVSVEETAGIQDLKLFPNPTSDVAHLELQLQSSTSLDIRLIDMTGRTVKNLLYEDRAGGTRRVSFSTSDLSSGIYAVQIRTDRGTVTERLMVD